MIGFELTLSDGTVTQGVIFHDQSVYIADPVADSYASESDMRANLPDAKMTILGTIMPLEKAKQFVEEHYLKNIETLERARKSMQDERDMYLAYLNQYEGAI